MTNLELHTSARRIKLNTTLRTIIKYFQKRYLYSGM